MLATGSPVLGPAPDPVDEDCLRENNNTAAAADDSDKESIISEINDQELEDYDANAAQLENRAVQIDEDIARSLKAKKRTDGSQSRKPKERTRDKKRTRDEDAASDGDGEGKRRRRNAGAGGVDSKKASPEPEKEKKLASAERRQRALNRAMDAALKNPVKRRRRKKDETDLEDALDDHLAALRVKMERACLCDNEARKENQPAIHKLELLPEVVGMLRRENAQSAVVDPESNFLQAIKFFLEPLDDASLPAYNIQRDIIFCLLRLPLEKEALIQSGLGKIMLHYTKSRQPQPQVKRMAEKLIEEWSRPILKRSHDYRKRHIETREFDPEARRGRQMTLAQRPAMTSQEAERARMLAPRPFVSGRAQIGGLPATYTIAPKSTMDPSMGGQRPIGASGIEAFRKMTQKKGRKG